MCICIYIYGAQGRMDHTSYLWHMKEVLPVCVYVKTAAPLQQVPWLIPLVLLSLLSASIVAGDDSRETWSKLLVSGLYRDHMGSLFKGC